MNLILLLLVPLCHGFANSPLSNLLVTRGIASGIRRGIYNEISIQNTIISGIVQAKDYHNSHPWILNAAISILLCGLLLQTSTSDNIQIRLWKRYVLSERLAKIFALVFLEVLTKNIEYAF